MDKEHDPEELPRRLVYLAAERTLTSWIRTALSLMALGFVIDRFDLIVHHLPGGNHAMPLHPRLLSTWGGSALIGMGVVMALAAGIRYLRFAMNYRRDGSTEVGHGMLAGAVFAVLLGLFGLGLIIALTVLVS